MYVVECYCMSILHFVACSTSIFVFCIWSLMLYIHIIFLSHVFIWNYLFCVLLFWYLDSIWSISFWCCQKGRSCSVSLELFYVFYVVLLYAMFQRGNQRSFAVAQSRLNYKWSLPIIKNGDTKFACPYNIQSENPSTILLLDF